VTATIEDVLSWQPCYLEEDDGERKIRAMAAPLPARFTAVDVLRLEVSVNDRLWAVLRPEMVSDAVARAWARWCALQVIHLWDAPVVVRQHLQIGRDDLRAAASDAAWAAVMAAARAGASDAAWAARAAASAAARAARDAAMAAASAAASAAMAGASDAAWAAASAAARAARAGASDAASAAAWAAARDAQAAKLFEMVEVDG
jgi:hypothetical protein